jgi:hypothetical protein
VSIHCAKRCDSWRTSDVEEPIDLPDGSEVTGIPKEELLDQEVFEGQLSPEEIAAILAAMDKLTPFEMTPEEEVAFASECQARKEREKAHFAEQAEKLGRMWD